MVIELWAVEEFVFRLLLLLVSDSQPASSSWCQAPFGADDQFLSFYE
jgi:hypothetical protein